MTRPQLAVTCDTSVLIPALIGWHSRHGDARQHLTEDVTAMPAHVLLEAYSVLTRLPAPHRLRPTAAAEVLAGITLPVIGLPPEDVPSLVAGLAQHGVSGGAAYDALVGATALAHDAELLTSDRRARTTYDGLGVRYRVV